MFRHEHWQNVVDVISFTTIHIKIRYDFKQKSPFFRFQNLAFLRLHKEYNVKQQHKKFENQRCKSFLIKSRVDRFVYKLNIFFRWKIYSIILITQFEFAFSIQNSYNRSGSDHSNSIYVENDTATRKSYEVKAIIDKRVKKFDRISVTQYKTKLLKYDSELDE